MRFAHACGHVEFLRMIAHFFCVVESGADKKRTAASMLAGDSTNMLVSIVLAVCADSQRSAVCS
jgi:hypothetical protein